MNREIKFRAWDGEAISYGVGVVNGKACDFEDRDDSVWFWHEQPKAIMQYTGLKDKNGKEIYEGDFIKDADLKSNYTRDGLPTFCKIVFKNGSFCTQADAEFYSSMLDRDFSESYVVIGNIYENPELLGGKA